MDINQHGPVRIEVNQVPGEEFIVYTELFNSLSGVADEFVFPRLFKGAGKAWEICEYNLDRLNAEFGALNVPIFHEWETGFQKRNTVEQILLSEHLKNSHHSSMESGYFLGSVDDQGIGLPDPAWEGISREDFLTARKNRSHIISALVSKTHLQRIVGGTTTIFLGGHSITPLHLHEPSFLLQILGKKKVLLIAPRFAEYLYCEKISDYTVNIQNFSNIDLEKFPLLKNVTIFETIIEPGDILYIPNRWFHYVEAIESPSCSLSRFTKPIKRKLLDGPILF